MCSQKSQDARGQAVGCQPGRSRPRISDFPCNQVGDIMESMNLNLHPQKRWAQYLLCLRLLLMSTFATTVICKLTGTLHLVLDIFWQMLFRTPRKLELTVVAFCSGDARPLGRKIDYWAIALSSISLMRSLYPQSRGSTTAVALAVTPFNPLAVSSANALAMEVRSLLLVRY